MLAYAPRPTARSGSPRTLLLVAGGHVVALALVLTARSEFAPPAPRAIPDVYFVKPIKPPPPAPPADPTEPRQPSQSTLDVPPRIVPTPTPPSGPLAEGPPNTPLGQIAGPALLPQPLPRPQPLAPAIVRTAARFITPAELVRPPYPMAKQRLGEEARLRLSPAIDARGRVTSVSPVGSADPAFLAAAQRHIVRHWRYQPASDGGAAIASTIVVTLTFTLEE